MTWEPEIAEIERRRQLALRMGGEERVRAQHARGKLTARERIAALVDADSWRERGVLGGTAIYDGAALKEFMPKRTIYGLARIDGRPVAVSADDFTARPGSGSAGEQGRHGGEGGVRGADQMALHFKLPCIRLIDGFGGDIRAVAALNRTYIPEMSIQTTVAMLNEVPLVTAALGSVAGGPAATATASHFSVMVKGLSQVFAAGPPVVRRALGIEVDKEQLGGYQIHTRTSGVIDNEAEDEQDAFRQIRRFLSYLPSSVHEPPPVTPCDDPPDRREEALLSLIPRNRNRPYDARRMVGLIVDRDSGFEIGRYFGRAQITMLARLNGRPVGVLANDPLIYGGSMDAAAAQKAQKFIELCDLFSLPVVNLADQPGFLIGVGAESAGTLKHGMRLFTTMEYLSVPWATVIVRRLYGVAGAAHQSHSRWNYRIAWPSGEWGSLPVEGGVAAAYRHEIEAAPDPAAYAEELEARLAAMRSPFRTAESLNIEDLIDPRDTRRLLCEWVDLAYAKRIPTILGPKRWGVRP